MPSSKAPPRKASRASTAPDWLVRPRARPLIMGIVNATPDSFFEGSRGPSAGTAVELGLRLAGEGADVLDIGGQSTRPGSDPVPEAEELRRVVPAVEKLSARLRIPISVDTDKAGVARRAREAGASVLNDIAALRGPGMLEEAVRFEAVILMHMLGDSPKTMQDKPVYRAVVAEVAEFLRERKAAFVAAGGDAARVLVDPGIGFGKTLEHNLALLKDLNLLSAIGPVVLGASRKSFLGRLMAPDGPLPGPEERLPGSLAVACWAASQGAAVVRVHDVRETRLALDAFAAARDGAAAHSALK